MSDTVSERAAKRGLRLAASDGVALMKAPKKRKRKIKLNTRMTYLIPVHMGMTRGELFQAMANDLGDYGGNRFKPIATVSSIKRIPLRQLRAMTTAGSILECLIELLDDRNIDVIPRVGGVMDYPLFLTRSQLAEIAGGPPGSVILARTCAQILKKIAARTL